MSADVGPWAGISFSEQVSLPTAGAEVPLFPTGWQASLQRELSLAIGPAAWPAADSLDVEAVSIRLQARSPKILGITFPEATDYGAGSAAPRSAEVRQSTDQSESPPEPAAAKPGKQTRIRPPADLVKLEDRLFFVLQPPLEIMLASSKLEFPFEPFPYQYDGIAFLFPREAAILADEMGLGKTMQAISAIRMLLLAGQARSVLLICPKPLVTNWVREFRLWAPEVPVTVVEGDAAKRRFIWSQRAAPVRIANYELLMRDRELLEEPDCHFDLVVLDEAQRIKNRHSSTAEIVRSLPRSRSWALTGTPIENSVEDLINIFEFLAPGYLRDDMHLKSISKACRDYILRRTKDKVLTEMPPKMYRDEELELTAAQQDSYRAAEEEGVVQLTDLGEMLTIQHVFELVLRLKQICTRSS